LLVAGLLTILALAIRFEVDRPGSHSTERTQRHEPATHGSPADSRRSQ
jgi:hypothetical protein